LKKLIDLPIKDELDIKNISNVKNLLRNKMALTQIKN